MPRAVREMRSMAPRWRPSPDESVGRESRVSSDPLTPGVGQPTTRARCRRTDAALISAHVADNDSTDHGVNGSVLVPPGSGPRGLMLYRALHSIVAIAGGLALAITRADAQLAYHVELQPGTRVRVQAPRIVTGQLEATVIARARDTVTLTTSRGVPIQVPLKTAEVSRGTARWLPGASSPAPRWAPGSARSWASNAGST